MSKRSWEETQLVEDTVRYILEEVRDDVLVGKLTSATCKNKFTFTREYVDKLKTRKGKGSSYIKMKIDSFSDEDYVCSGVVNNAFLGWLKAKNPMISICDDYISIAGERRFEKRPFNECLRFTSDCYYKMEAAKFNLPKCLRELNNTFKEELSKLYVEVFAPWMEEKINSGVATHEDVVSFNEEYVMNAEWKEYTPEEYLAFLNASFDKFIVRSTSTNVESVSSATK